MRLLKLAAKYYRSLRDESVELRGFNLFIGANASGKSTILDALRFLHEGVEARDFRPPVFSRGGIVHLAWKGEEARQVELVVSMEDGAKTYEWSVRLIRDGYDFYIEEQLEEVPFQSPPIQLLHANKGEGWWWSGEKGERVTLKQSATSCALAAAAADASFPARDVAVFASRWGFFDPNPFLLRRDWIGLDSGRFDSYGRNLGETLFALRESSPEVLNQVIESTRSILGLPLSIETRETEGRCYFVQNEPGLQFPVHQMGVSSGTLRVLALMTALLGEPGANMIGIEEPENYIHPAALSSFVEHLLGALPRVQFMVTTHSPILLDFVNDPATIRVVHRSEQGGTIVEKGKSPDDVKRALAASGFGLGEFYQTKGFGS